jgi:hypothetical protein
MPGCWPQPMARLQQGSRRQSPQVQPTSGIPCAMALRLIRTLPGDRALLPPSPADHHRRLGISVGMPGPYDFAVRNRSFVGMIGSCCDRLRPPRPALNVRDDREAPLLSSTGPNQHSTISEKWNPKNLASGRALADDISGFWQEPAALSSPPLSAADPRLSRASRHALTTFAQESLRRCPDSGPLTHPTSR